MISVVHLFLYIKLPETPRMDFHNEEFAANYAYALIFLSIHTGIFLVLQLQMASVDFGWQVHPSGKKNEPILKLCMIKSAGYLSYSFICCGFWSNAAHSCKNDAWNHFGLYRGSVNHCTIPITMFT